MISQTEMEHMILYDLCAFEQMLKEEKKELEEKLRGLATNLSNIEAQLLVLTWALNKTKPIELVEHLPGRVYGLPRDYEGKWKRTPSHKSVSVMDPAERLLKFKHLL